jgi:hypothetical protein
MKRRDFLKASSAAALAFPLPALAEKGSGLPLVHSRSKLEKTDEG